MSETEPRASALTKLRERQRALEIEVHVVAGKLAEVAALIEAIEGNGRRKKPAPGSVLKLSDELKTWGDMQEVP